MTIHMNGEHVPSMIGPSPQGRSSMLQTLLLNTTAISIRVVHLETKTPNTKHQTICQSPNTIPISPTYSLKEVLGPNTYF